MTSTPFHEVPLNPSPQLAPIPPEVPPRLYSSPLPPRANYANEANSAASPNPFLSFLSALSQRLRASAVSSPFLVTQ
jgi:hypothetical protein